MSLGEVNFDDFYENFGGNEVSRTFALGILVLMILSVTITMVNLFVAVIISDREKMVKDVFKQNLLYMAQCSQLTHNLLKNQWVFNLIKTWFDVDAMMLGRAANDYSAKLYNHGEGPSSCLLSVGPSL